jgi:hypothetical protein
VRGGEAGIERPELKAGPETSRGNDAPVYAQHAVFSSFGLQHLPSGQIDIVLMFRVEFHNRPNRAKARRFPEMPDTRRSWVKRRWRTGCYRGRQKLRRSIHV